ncbi:hypothetical protein GGI23_000889 [Coemansia sp. RSA 2559]|nr:hypothetical protein GGI23_000889 [Coemansia sp. RSA 2559]KAJ2868622.1 hypothetical protein GGI22_000774 [Coemansia erecta]
MSGGVDSSVAASLLKDRGYDVEAVFMRNWDTRDERDECPSERDYRDVQSVCAQLGIKCHLVNLVKEYWNTVFAVALDAYAQGLTPNPDILCNSEIKFGVLLDHIGRITGGRRWWFATGHYARLLRDQSSGDVQLHRGADGWKDQSYYLAGVPAASFGRVVFPLGSLSKSEDVRRIAREKSLATANKEESMGICFVGERRKFDHFLAEYIPQKEGDIVSNDGHQLGTHRGIFTRTIGQAAGIPGLDTKWYVYAKDIRRNRMYAAPGRNDPLLYKKSVRAGPAHWISGTPPVDLGLVGRITLEAQVRFMQKPQKCTVTMDQR